MYFRKSCSIVAIILSISLLAGCLGNTHGNIHTASETEYSLQPSETISLSPSSSTQTTLPPKEENSKNPTYPTLTTQPPSTEAITTESKPINSDIENVPYGIVYDVSEDKVLWMKNADEKVFPASLTKLLTAYTALHYVSKDTIFTVGSEQELVNPHSSLCLIREGHRLTLYDLICGMLMASGNDAAYTIAVNTARFVYDRTMTDTDAVQAFCNLMNHTAKEIGMLHSNFCNPDGWDNENHYTTVNDLLQLSLCVYENDDIRTIAEYSEKYVVFVSGQNITWKNTNELLHESSKYYYPYATGLKTGTTNNAGKCLITTAEKNGKNYIVIGMGCKTDAQRYNFAISMLNKVFNI